MSGYPHVIASAPAAPSARGVRCRLFSHSAGHGVRTSTATATPSARFKSRTAAVSITMSPGDCPLLRAHPESCMSYLPASRLSMTRDMQT